MYYLVVAV